MICNDFNLWQVSNYFTGYLPALKCPYDASFGPADCIIWLFISQADAVKCIDIFILQTLINAIS